MPIDFNHINWNLIVSLGNYVFIPFSLWLYRKVDKLFTEKVGHLAQQCVDASCRDINARLDSQDQQMQQTDKRMERIEFYLINGKRKPNGSDGSVPLLKQ